jgi:uncharacterized protein (TIGR03118 family)
MSIWKSLRPSFARSAVVVVSLLLAAGHLAAQNAFVQTNLVSDLAGVALHTDANLVNPWGISASSTSPLWIANNGSGTSTLYNGAGTAIALVVTIPPPAGGTPPSAPTGTVFNGTGQFAAAPGKPGLFLFSTEDGTIAAWNPGTGAVLKVDKSASGAVYKGLALGANESGPVLYATNFRSGRVEAYNGTFAEIGGAFYDFLLPRGYAPFGIMVEANNNVIVTYAQQDEAMHDDVAGSGRGFVDEFDPDGNFLRRLISRGALDSPWGLAMAPSTGFGAFNGALLVGNFGDGRINAYNLLSTNGDFFFPSFDSAVFIDALRDPDGQPITNLGLWGLRFGNGGSGGAVSSLYFTAGIPGSVGTLDVLENHGLFGVLNVGMIDAAATAPPSNQPGPVVRGRHVAGEGR